MRVAWRFRGIRSRRLKVTSCSLFYLILIQRLIPLRHKTQTWRCRILWMVHNTSHECQLTLKTTLADLSRWYWSAMALRFRKFKGLRRSAKATTLGLHGDVHRRSEKKSSFTASTMEQIWKNYSIYPNTKQTTIHTSWRSSSNVNRIWLASVLSARLGRVHWERIQEQLKRTTAKESRQEIFQFHSTIRKERWTSHGITAAHWTTRIILIIL